GACRQSFPRLAERSFRLSTGNHGGRYINPHREAHRLAPVPASSACAHDRPSQNEGQVSHARIALRLLQWKTAGRILGDTDIGHQVSVFPSLCCVVDLGNKEIVEGASRLSQSFFDHPILNSPYEPPSRYHALDKDGQPLERPPID